MKYYKNGFTTIELLVVIAIIGVLATVVTVSLLATRDKARDTKRMSDLNQIGRFLTFGCLTPPGGAGEYDLADLVAQYKLTYPQHADKIPDNIYDPKSGSITVSNYKYIVDNNKNCVLYANLEKEEAELTLTSSNVPTPRGGKGVFQGLSAGVNGTDKYFQVSN